MQLFSLLGFKVRADASWLVLALLVTWSLAESLFPASYPGLPAMTYWSMGIAGMAGLVFSIVFHELSHALVARRHGLPIKGITLFIFGGVAEMDEEPETPRVELLMAIAGPIASFALALAFYASALAGAAWGLPQALLGVLGYLALINGMLAAFNLVPAFPLDGGRVFRALLWRWKGDFRWDCHDRRRRLRHDAHLRRPAAGLSGELHRRHVVVPDRHVPACRGRRLLPAIVDAAGLRGRNRAALHDHGADLGPAGPLHRKAGRGLLLRLPP
jgi:Zn-dependent protease